MIKFLEKLQNSDEATKRLWTVILSSVSMTVVIFVWFAYFDNMFAGFSAPQITEAEESSFTFLDTMKSGAAVIYSGASEKLGGFWGALGEPREYIISPSE